MHIEQNHVAKMIHVLDIEEGDLLDLGEGGTHEILAVTIHNHMARLDFADNGYAFVAFDRPIVIQRWMS
jgi:hypothetical protein